MKRGVAFMRGFALPPCVLAVRAELDAEVNTERHAESTARPVESQSEDLSC